MIIMMAQLGLNLRPHLPKPLRILFIGNGQIRKENEYFSKHISRLIFSVNTDIARRGTENHGTQIFKT